MRALQRRTSALAIALVMTLALLASGPFTNEAGAHPARRRGPAARKLQARSGWGQWPVCSRRIGAR